MFVPWAVELGLITVRDLGITLPGGLNAGKGSGGHTVNGLPLPADYLATFLIFVPLSILSDTRVGKVADLIGWAYVLATLLSAIDPADPLNPNTGGSQPNGTAPAQGGATNNG